MRLRELDAHKLSRDSILRTKRKGMRGEQKKVHNITIVKRRIGCKRREDGEEREERKESTKERRKERINRGEKSGGKRGEKGGEKSTTKPTSRAITFAVNRHSSATTTHGGYDKSLLRKVVYNLKRCGCFRW